MLLKKFTHLPVLVATLCAAFMPLQASTSPSPNNESRPETPRSDSCEETLLAGPRSGGQPYSLRPITRSDAKKWVRTALGFQYVSEGGKKYGVPWAFISGNHCLDRATFIAFTLGIDPATTRWLPKTVSDRVLRRLEKNPTVETLNISLAGPIRGKVAYLLPNGRKLKTVQDIEWYAHTAVVVNIEGRLNVIDLSLSAEPMSIRKWVNAWLGPGTEAPEVSISDYMEIAGYYGKWSEALPKYRAGYRLAPFFVESSPHPPPGGTIRQELESLKYGFAMDYSNFRVLLENEGIALGDDDIPWVRAKFTRSRD
jgi:hypothetical protein